MSLLKLIKYGWLDKFGIIISHYYRKIESNSELVVDELVSELVSWLVSYSWLAGWLIS